MARPGPQQEGAASPAAVKLFLLLICDRVSLQARSFLVQRRLEQSPVECETMRELGFAQARQFSTESWLDQMEHYYQHAFSLQAAR
jgi:hypothetical protein